MLTRLQTTLLSLALLIAGLWNPATRAEDAPQRIDLDSDWKLSSSKINASGDTISTADFKPAGWQSTTVPSTVVGSLVESGHYTNPFFGTNLRSLPGMSYPIGANFSLREMPTNSPFHVSWWYRREFQLPTPRIGQVWLHFLGINYRANIWLNGKLIASDKEVAGAYRTYEFNVTDAVAPAWKNVLAVEVFPPEPDNLALTWVDWNPAPPDKDMGLWREVYLTTTGPVEIRHPQIVTKLNLPALTEAALTVRAELHNATDKAVRATLQGQIESVNFKQTAQLGPHEHKEIVFAPDTYTQLVFSNPRLWWPTEIGPQNLHNAEFTVLVDGKISDTNTVQFGMREATSELDAKGHRVFKINGQPILIRGGGWAPDMFLRSSAVREAQELSYVTDMHLNAIRFEGKTESDRFLNTCDELGIMVIAGWCCCDFWEKWPKWKDVDYEIAKDSLRDQTKRIRNHPSVITWWYGSDNPPNERAEKNYLDVFKEVHWPNSFQSSASGAKSPVGEKTGIRMTGPYEYVPPVYWYVDKKAGGAYSFNTETSPGPAIPVIESLREMLPPEHLWPIDDVWSFHSGGGPFKHLDIFTEALAKRLGAATNVEEYSRKAQFMAYDGERAMFEAYGRNKFDSTGVIQWMMNNAWPSMIWHLYDYYLRPGGGYFGAKKACEPLHIQYSYDDRSIVIVNNYFWDFSNSVATVKIYNLDGAEKFSQKITTNVLAATNVRLMTLPTPEGLSSVYFVRLELADEHGEMKSRNDYALSLQPDTLGEPKEGSDWYYTPTKQFADFTALEKIPPAKLKIGLVVNEDMADEAVISVQNASKTPAFFLRFQIYTNAVNSMGNARDINPVYWNDNFVTIFPGETRTMIAKHNLKAAKMRSYDIMFAIEGWNVSPIYTNGLDDGTSRIKWGGTPMPP